jgi:hypothetical protein
VSGGGDEMDTGLGLQGLGFDQWLLKRRRTASWEPSHRSPGDVAASDVAPYEEDSDVRRHREVDGPWAGRKRRPEGIISMG